MTDQGWISLHRKIQDSIIYSDSQAVHLFIHLLLKANHTDKDFLFNGALTSVKRGQVLTGRKALSVETGINESKIQRLLKTFETCNMIEQQTNNKNRLISIVNYHLYQSSEHQTNIKRTTDEQQMNTNNNVNNVNNDNKGNKSTKADPIPYSKIAQLYNEVCTNLPKVLNPEKLNDKRKRAIKKFWNHSDEVKNSEYLAKYFEAANLDDFLTGNNQRGWKADLEFLMRIEQHDKLREKSHA